MDGQPPVKPDDTDKLADEYQAASKATAEAEYEEYSKNAATYTAPKHRVRKMLIVLGVLLVLVAVGFGVYWFLLKDTGKKSADTESQNGTQQTSQPAASVEISTKTKHHISNSFMLEFDYPEDWEVTETAGSGQLTAQSPALPFKAATGESVTGRILFRIRNKQQALPEFDKGNAVAALESEKITYAKPSSVQRGSTYLSFLRFATSSDGLDGLYITGDTGYQAEQAIPMADFTPVDPVISLAFEKCADSDCSGESTATGVAETVWQDVKYSTPVKALFQSLVIN